MNFPKEIIEEFLMRLPVKFLMRFKCVSKDWNDFISDDSFRICYCSSQHSKSNALTGFICHGKRVKVSYVDGGYGYWYKSEFLCTSKDYVENEELTSLDYLYRFNVLAASKGLLLLRCNRESLRVYDLVSKKHVNIPSFPKVKYPLFLTFGFKCEEKNTKQGVDCHRHCRFLYKVFAIGNVAPINNIWIYSSETGIWQKTITKANPTFFMKWGDIVKVIEGVFYWYVVGEPRFSAYDSDDPNGRAVIIEFPDRSYYYSEESMELRVTKDASLQLINITHMTMDVWITNTGGRSYMHEDIVDASKWNLVHSVYLFDICFSLDRLLNEPRIIGIDPDDACIIYMEIANHLYAYYCHEEKVVIASSKKIAPEAEVFVHTEWPTWPCL